MFLQNISEGRTQVRKFSYQCLFFPVSLTLDERFDEYFNNFLGPTILLDLVFFEVRNPWHKISKNHLSMTTQMQDGVFIIQVLLVTISFLK